MLWEGFDQYLWVGLHLIHLLRSVPNCQIQCFLCCIIKDVVPMFTFWRRDINVVVIRWWY